ncbi:transposase [Streptomyces sp. NBC_00775]|uniref:transposase n=1 Tax=Streptomyces sp. NBC_00775 TaxID=2975828 RepID=UPI003FA68B90
MPGKPGLQGILYVLHQDISWQLLPLELGFGSGQTCWRRLDRWQKAGSSSNCTACCSPRCMRSANSTGVARA